MYFLISFVFLRNLIELWLRLLCEELLVSQIFMMYNTLGIVDSMLLITLSFSSSIGDLSKGGNHKSGIGITKGSYRLRLLFGMTSIL